MRMSKVSLFEHNEKAYEKLIKALKKINVQP